MSEEPSAALMASGEQIFTAWETHYLHGFSLKQLNDAHFFKRLGDFNAEGFCHTVSAAMMLVLKDFPGARWMRGKIKPERDYIKHSWVEVEIDGFAWAIDPCALNHCLTPLTRYDELLEPIVMRVYDYHEFWQVPAAKIFYRRMLAPTRLSPKRRTLRLLEGFYRQLKHSKSSA